MFRYIRCLDALQCFCLVFTPNLCKLEIELKMEALSTTYQDG